MPVHLKAGKNLLLVKVPDVSGSSGLHVWFEDPCRNPLEVKNELP